MKLANKYWAQIIFAAFCFLQVGCKKIEVTPQQVILPEGFPAVEHQMYGNPTTKEGFELGKKLFYDTRLSQNNTIACASCHEHKAAFGTYNHDRSHGIFESHTLRNAPPLINLIWQKYLHWDGAFTSITAEAMQPITSHLEMGETMHNVVKKLSKDEVLCNEFEKAFGNKKITAEKILNALAQFTSSLISVDSKYDQYKKGNAAFTANEERGYQLFTTHCTGCHPEPLFTDNSFKNIGLPVDALLNDYGRMMHTGLAADSFMFRVPTLRNVAVTANYMHDGRFGTLAQCINHYRTGVVKGHNTHPLVENKIALTDAETIDLIHFLYTLTDSAFLSNTKFDQ